MRPKWSRSRRGREKWPRYYVHYLGWNARYDEWVRRSKVAENLSWTKDRVRQWPSAKEESETEVKAMANTPSSTASSIKSEDGGGGNGEGRCRRV